MSRIFERAWISRELDSGCTMNFHPENGWILTEGIFFRPIERIWYYYVHKGGWDDTPDVKELAPISVGRDVQVGDSYPDHWAYDPWTGKNLRTGMTFKEEMFQSFFQQGEKA